MARRSSRNRLDQPRDTTRGVVLYDPEVFGRLSERVARFIGSARFIFWMTVFVVAWLLWNTLASDSLRFDPFPFIFLTLMLSLQASYAAPLILLAQNRQSDRDRVQYLEDRNLTDRLLADTEYLTREIASVRLATGDLATRDFLRGEVRDLAEELTTLLSKEQPSPEVRRQRDYALGGHGSAKDTAGSRPDEDTGASSAGEGRGTSATAENTEASPAAADPGGEGAARPADHGPTEAQ